ncbi:MAG: hypothetical protein K6G69_10750 [Lachnospiraceae bacterium]|nr:hypothetical protein [Lachnospiraceae bacterium]
MEQTKNYIQWIRSKVGHEKIILTFAGGAISYSVTVYQKRKEGNADWLCIPGRK